MQARIADIQRAEVVERRIRIDRQGRDPVEQDEIIGRNIILRPGHQPPTIPRQQFDLVERKEVAHQIILREPLTAPVEDAKQVGCHFARGQGL